MKLIRTAKFAGESEAPPLPSALHPKDLDHLRRHAGRHCSRCERARRALGIGKRKRKEARPDG